MNPERAKEIREAADRYPWPIVLGYDTREDPQNILPPNVVVEGDDEGEYLRGEGFTLSQMR